MRHRLSSNCRTWSQKTLNEKKIKKKTKKSSYAYQKKHQKKIDLFEIYFSILLANHHPSIYPPFVTYYFSFFSETIKKNSGFVLFWKSFFSHSSPYAFVCVYTICIISQVQTSTILWFKILYTRENEVL